MIFLTLGCNEKDVDSNDNDLYNLLGLKGDVESVVVSSYDILNIFGKEQVGNIRYKTIYRFNKQGNLTELCDYNSKDQLCSRDTYTYDDNGDIIEHCSYSNNSDNWDYRHIYTYDNKGYKIREEIFQYDNNANLSYKCTYYYDKKGREIEFCRYNSEGDKTYKYTSKYDNKSNLIENKFYDIENMIETPTSIKKYEITYR